MISKYKIALECDCERVPYNLGYQLYGALMQRLPPEICELLHESGMAPLSQCFCFDSKTKKYSWNICAFDDKLAESILQALSIGKSIRIECENIRFQISDLSKEYISSARELMQQAKTEFEDASQIEVKLLTPTAFKQNGSYVLYPTVQMMVGNLINKWNTFNEDMVIEDEYAVSQIINGLSISHYKLQSANYNMKGVKISGFVGEVTLHSRLPEPLLEIAKLVFYFANYSGIGIKSTLGMGGASAMPKRTKVRI